MGKPHLMAYDPAGKDFRWSTYSVVTGGGFGVAVLFSATALAAVAAPSSSSIQSSSGLSNLHSALDRYNARAGQRRSATEPGSDRTFVLTRVEEGRKKGIGLVGISLESGENAKQLLLDDKGPHYVVDESSKRLLYFKGGRQLTAYGL